ncbi:hypothetical protein [Viridibacterium curvum]|uniref:Uncharacterized protein n=1 Tax=Viridibacterium curvum TaxID=1101404 RepID=A0ABP9QKK8_9RHOO
MQRLLCLLMLGVLLTACEKGPEKPKQKTTVTLLPDTPPPPPPPPPKEVPPPPKDAPREVKIEAPKQDAPPQTEQLKSNEPAGDAPSNIGVGDPTREYTGQPLGVEKGGQLGGVDRMVFETYKTRLQRLLQEELVKMKDLKDAEYRIPARIRREGAQWTVVLPNSTGDAKKDELLREAVARAIQREAPPASTPQGGFDIRVSNKLLN